MQFPHHVNPMASGIYVITCLPNGKVYVGGAKTLERRFKRHVYELGRGGHFNARLQAAWVRYGMAEFRWETIEIVADLADLASREQHHMDRLEACGPKGFNLFPTARSPLGSRHSDRTKARIAASAKRIWKSAERLAKIAARTPGATGIKIPAECMAKRAAIIAAKKAVGVQPRIRSSAKRKALLAMRRIRDAIREASWTPEQAVYRAAQRHAVYETHKEERRAARLADIENCRAHENELDKVRRAARTLQQVEQDNAEQRAARAANAEVHRARDRARRPAKAVLEAQASPDEAAAILDARNAQARVAYAARRAADIEASRAKNRAAYAAKKAVKAAGEAAKSEEAQSLKLAAD